MDQRCSILVPAYQESENIKSTLRSLVELEYPNYEIIVVDDGSSDETFEKANKFSQYDSSTISVLRKDNGGKWSALNLAFKHAKYEFILCVNADSRLSRNALQLLVPHLRDSSDRCCMWASYRPQLRGNIITKLQALEYVISNGGFENRAKPPWFGDVRTRSDWTLPEIEFGADCQIGRQDRGACQTRTRCRPLVGRDVC